MMQAGGLVKPLRRGTCACRNVSLLVPCISGPPSLGSGSFGKNFGPGVTPGPFPFLGCRFLLQRGGQLGVEALVDDAGVTDKTAVQVKQAQFAPNFRPVHRPPKVLILENIARKRFGPAQKAALVAAGWHFWTLL